MFSSIDSFVCFLTILLIVQLLYWLLFYIGLATKKPSNGNSKASQISVIICSQNDCQNLVQCLSSVLNQKSALAEIIVVDDFSIDDTKNTVQSLSKNENNLIYVKSKFEHPGKKIALDTGIKHASGKYVLLTDADTLPNPSWADLMSSQLSHQQKIVLGHAPFYKSKSFVNKWSRFENILGAFQYLTAALIKIPYMGVGRSLLYQKDLYTSSDLLTKHLDLSSGDDDLFINQVATGDNTAICIDPDSFVYSSSEETWKDYIAQKRRHYSTSHRYKLRHKVFLSLFSFSHLLFFSFLFYLTLNGNALVALTYFSIRLFLCWIFFSRLAFKFKESDLIIWWPILDLLLVLHYIYFSFFVLFPQNQKWRNT